MIHLWKKLRYKFVQTDDNDFGKIAFFQDVEMGIFTYNEIRACLDGAVDKFIVIIILTDKPKVEVWGIKTAKGTVDYRFNNILGNK